MDVSFYSVLMSVFWSSLGVFILYRCLKRRWFIRRFGIQILCALYLLCGLRLFFPVEIKGVKVISLEGVLASAYRIVGLQKAEQEAEMTNQHYSSKDVLKSMKDTIRGR